MILHARNVKMATSQSLVCAEMPLIYSKLFNKDSNYSGHKEGEEFC